MRPSMRTKLVSSQPGHSFPRTSLSSFTAAAWSFWLTRAPYAGRQRIRIGYRAQDCACRDDVGVLDRGEVLRKHSSGFVERHRFPQTSEGVCRVDGLR